MRRFRFRLFRYILKNMKRPINTVGEIYHIYNRGVDKRDTYLEDRDYLRFIHNLYEFNDTAPAGKFSQAKLSEVSPPKVVPPPEK